MVQKAKSPVINLVNSVALRDLIPALKGNVHLKFQVRLKPTKNIGHYT
jgi:hypothetical protein